MSNTVQPDVVLVNPGNRLQIYQSLGATLSAIEPPVWPALMATFLRRRGFSVELLDANALDLTPEDTARQIVDMNPRLVVVAAYGHNPSASTQVMPAAGAVCRAVKQAKDDVKIIMLGGHVAALPERTLQEEAVDYVCTGEGLFTIADLLECLKANGKLSAVRGLCHWEHGRPVRTAPAPNVEALDEEIPGMSWDLLPMHEYRAHNWHCFGFLDRRQPYASLYTTLGCPYHCTYCCIQAPFKEGERALGYVPQVNSYRLWSPESVVAQIDQVVNTYGVRNIKFADEMFVLNKRHVNAICDRLLERGYDLNIWAYARVDTVKDGMAEKLRAAGFRWLCFGIEAGSRRVRDEVLKSYEQEQVYRTIQTVRQAGISVIANYIFGLPEDDNDTMQATLDLALDLNCEFANFYSAMAYPGSPLYEQAIRHGWPLPDTWSGYSQHSVDCLPLPTKYLSGSEVLAFRDHAWNTYFERPAYRDMIERTFGIETRRHVEDMAAYSLPRRYANGVGMPVR
ncbi:MAG: radical SAM protein [Nitrospirae bacterium]|nr:MAG: radical SAM protein [Nitrospirota bacterium]